MINLSGPALSITREQLRGLDRVPPFVGCNRRPCVDDQDGDAEAGRAGAQAEVDLREGVQRIVEASERTEVVRADREDGRQRRRHLPGTHPLGIRRRVVGQQPENRLDTTVHGAEELADQVIAYLTDHGYVGWSPEI